MRVQITLVNASKHYRFYDEVEDWGDKSLAEIYHAAQAEYGRCASKVYQDSGVLFAAELNAARPVGWVFVKRVQYTDCKEKYLQEAWVVPVNVIPEKREPIGL